jgi:hypothetical protein
MIFGDDTKDISAATCSLPLSDLIAGWRAGAHPLAPTTIDRFTVTRVVTSCFDNSTRLLFPVEVIPYGGASPYAVVSSPPTRRPSVTGWSMASAHIPVIEFGVLGQSQCSFIRDFMSINW